MLLVAHNLHAALAGTACNSNRVGDSITTGCGSFCKDTSFGLRTSVGLGGNISKSIFSMKEGQTPTPRFESSGAKNATF